MGRRTVDGGPAQTPEERLAQKRDCLATSLEKRKAQQKAYDERRANKKKQAAGTLNPATTPAKPQHGHGDDEMDVDEAIQEDQTQATQTLTIVTPHTAVVQPPPHHTGARGPYTGTSQRTINRKTKEMRSELERTGPPAVQAMVLTKLVNQMPQAVGLNTPLDSVANAAIVTNLRSFLEATKPGSGCQPIAQQRSRDAVLQAVVGDGSGFGSAQALARHLGGSKAVTANNIREAIKAWKATSEAFNKAMSGDPITGAAVRVRFSLGNPRVKVPSSRYITPETKLLLIQLWEQSGKPSPSHFRKYWIDGVK